MSKVHYCTVVLLLLTLGFGTLAYKVVALDFPLTPHTESLVWTIEAEVTFNGRGKPAKASLFIPQNSEKITVLDETFVSGGYGLISKLEGQNRLATWSTRAPRGRQILYYRALVQTTNDAAPQKLKKVPRLTKPNFEGAKIIAANALIQEVTEHSADLETFVLELTQLIKTQRKNGNVKALLGKTASVSTQLSVMANLLAMVDIPARMVHGVRMVKQGRRIPTELWLEVFDKEKMEWRGFDYIAGKFGIPSDYFAWWWGDESISTLKGGSRLDVTLSVHRSEEQALVTALEAGKRKKPFFFKFSLFSLPLQIQAVYKILLLVPLGALMVILLRNVVGIKTFGTFMPVLISLSFRETELLWGMGLFVFITAIGLSFRFYLDRLKLLFVPRLAAVLTGVVIFMMSMSIISYNLGITHGLSVALFPMVIITMTIERMSIVWEEEGSGHAIWQGLGSLLTATLAYWIYSYEAVEHVLFVFPEILLVVLACMLLLGRYTGYRLLELARFRPLAERR